MLVRGISDAAILSRSSVFGSNYTADEVFDSSNQCGWTPGSGNTTFYSLNMVRPQQHTHTAHTDDWLTRLTRLVSACMCV